MSKHNFFNSRRIKLVIAGPPNSGKNEFMRALALRFPNSVLRDYKVGWMDVLRLDFLCDPPGAEGDMIEVNVHALVGQIDYGAMYEILMSNASAVLMMIDINPARMQEGLQVKMKTMDSVKKRGLDVREIPMVFQYHHAEYANQELVEQWDQLLDLQNNRIPRFFSASNFAEGSFTGFDLLVRETMRQLFAQRSA